MSGTTEIQWTATYNADGTVTPGRTWNPVVGCERVSAGCRNCYAYSLHDMRHKAKLEGKKLPDQYRKPFKEVQLFPNRLWEPFSWKQPGRVFVNSMSDLFHESVPFEFIDQVFAVMAMTPHLTYQVLTKRAARMLEYFTANRGMVTVSLPAAETTQWRIWTACGELQDAKRSRSAPWRWATLHGREEIAGPWPLPNVHLGVSVENQPAADERIGKLLGTPAVVRFISGEPLLGPVNLRKIAPEDDELQVGYDALAGALCGNGEPGGPRIDWVIVGGESGAGARPMHPDWARSLRDQCQAAGVPFFFKQWGGWHPADGLEEKGEFHGFRDGAILKRIGKKAGGRLLDGREWNEFPEVK